MITIQYCVHVIGNCAAWRYLRQSHQNRTTSDTPKPVRPKTLVYHSLNSNKEQAVFKRSILQTFWKTDCVTRSLFFELETSNFGYLLIF